MEEGAIINYDCKPDVELEIEPNSVCRCCLNTDRRMEKVELFRELFMDFAEIIVSESDGLPQWVCWECSALLQKCVNFKLKVLRIHSLLHDYHNRCAPFPIDGQDPELKIFAAPYLCATPTLTFDNSDSRNGYHEVLEHENNTVQSKLYDMHIDDFEADNLDIKYEYCGSEGEDNMPLEEIRLNKNKETEEIQDDPQVRVKDESREKKKKVKKKDKLKKKKLVKKENDETEQLDAMKPKRSMLRKTLDLDESKIRVITLDPAEQIKQREEESKSSIKFPYQCHLCFKGFNFEMKLKNHMHKHSPSRGPIKCETCSMYLPSNYSASVHALIHTRRFECVKCGRRMTDRHAILNHYRSQHEGVLSVFTCHICGKTCNNEKTHRGHMRNHHYGARAECPECGKTFVNKDSLHEHQLIHQGVKNYECTECKKKFRTRNQIQHHMLRHSKAKDYYCVECDVRFKSAHSLRQHLKRTNKHKDLKSLKFICDTCGKRFSSGGQLAAHARVQHEGVRAHRCGDCGAALASRASLAKHARAVHAGERAPPAHVCHACGKLFRAKSTLVNHVRTHTGEKPFECSECGRKFAQRTAMRTHVKLVHLKIHRSAKMKPKPPPEAPAPVVFEWGRPLQACEFFTVTAGP